MKLIIDTTKFEHHEFNELFYLLRKNQYKIKYTDTDKISQFPIKTKPKRRYKRRRSYVLSEENKEMLRQKCLKLQEMRRKLKPLYPNMNHYELLKMAHEMIK